MASPLFWMETVSPEYFHVMNVPLLAGRSFSTAEMSGNPPVAIVDAETARRYWPGQGAIGKHIRPVDQMEWRTVIGVAADVRADYGQGVLNGCQAVIGFLIEAIVLCLLGGIAGIIVGAGGAALLNKLGGFNTTVDPGAVALAFAFSAGVGVLFGVWPARRAASLDPIIALRYE